MEEFRAGRNSEEAMRIAFSDQEIADRAFTKWGARIEPLLRDQISATMSETPALLNPIF